MARLVQLGGTPSLAAQDGAALARSMLVRGRGVTVLPKNVVLEGSIGQVGDVGFVDGRPDSVTLAATSLARNRRIVADLLSEAEVPTLDVRMLPATSVSSMTSRAEQLGWPVMIRPVMRETREPWVVGCLDATDLEAGLEVLAADRRAPKRVVVSRQLKGAATRVLVSGGTVVGAIEQRRGLAELVESPRDATAVDVPSELGDLATAAVSAVPGLEHAAVDIVTTSRVLRREHQVVDLDPLAAPHSLGPASSDAAERLVGVALAREQYPAHSGVAVRFIDVLDIEVLQERLLQTSEIAMETPVAERDAGGQDRLAATVRGPLTVITMLVDSVVREGVCCAAELSPVPA
jgi:hypothetical protein